MWILGINRHHNSSVCLLKDGEIVFHGEEERFSRKKYDVNPIKSLLKVFDYTDRIDKLAVTGFKSPLNNIDMDSYDIYSTIVSKFSKTDFTFHESILNHHELHAACAFYNSGFNKSLVVVADGAGSFIRPKVQEIESIYLAEYPCKFTLLYKRDSADNYISSGWMFEGISDYLGFMNLEAGKVMGLSSYGKPNNSIPDLNNHNLFDGYKSQPSVKFLSQNLDDSFETKADLSYAVQQATQQKVLNLILHALSLSDCKNVCLTGGYALNCVANYFYLQHLPKDVNLYCEPISSDAGTSIGAAKHIHHVTTGDTTIRKHKNIYYGSNYNPYFHNMKDCEYSDVAKLLVDGKIVCMYQGGAESGPRALGNRSILFDPRIHNGKDIVNTVKHREYFRPFAGSILLEHVHDWFDMRGLEESPFMMFAVNVLENKKHIIPSITHVDGTCRVQTVSEQQNYHYYNLIKQFYNITGVPILFNTSFNLAGEPLVETPEDAINTFTNSDIDYLYFPENKKLICK